MSDRAKLARLVRLERVRAIARQTAAGEAAQAETTLARLQALAMRSRALAAEYEHRSDALNGAELRHLAAFAGGLHAVCRTTGADAARAQAIADQRQVDLAGAERRRTAVAEHAGAVTRTIVAGTRTPILNARRRSGGA